MLTRWEYWMLVFGGFLCLLGIYGTIEIVVNEIKVWRQNRRLDKHIRESFDELKDREQT